MQLATDKRLAINSQRENRFPLDALLGMGIYSGAKTTGFIAWATIQFSHRWVNWESICPALGIYLGRWVSIRPISCCPPPLLGLRSSWPWQPTA
ncbi:hypothetical protein Pan181_38530 [Aeoliella mucimassa]|uniref:Uncharacterized protein n=1 Tax=Aeoliella mucimassa TaxID=2527972 RepID=A0A518ASD4_9BACT|nr:hypothetical protein Pan181_38530 [Aeoliella mucimassa]